MTIKQETKLLIPQKQNWLIISDLDGTLLDHYTYSHKAVDSLLHRLNEINVPVIFNSSKTATEIVELRKEMNNSHPFIVENGSAVYLPHGYFADKDLPSTDLTLEEIDQEAFLALHLGAEREQLLNFLHQDIEQHSPPCLSFSNVSTEELVEATGLSLEKIEKSRQRHFSEPLLWQGTEDEKRAFAERANDAGLNTLQGGRFLHLLGQCDKGRAAKALASVYCNGSQQTQDWGMIASGDSGNDLDMLQVADIAVLIRSPSHALPTLADHPHLIVSDSIGPPGWSEVMGELFDSEK